ncbi:MAG: hypothetical protein RI946_410, partial [Pseudomonadota bacterium]
GLRRYAICCDLVDYFFERTAKSLSLGCAYLHDVGDEPCLTKKKEH